MSKACKHNHHTLSKIILSIFTIGCNSCQHTILDLFVLLIQIMII